MVSYSYVSIKFFLILFVYLMLLYTSFSLAEIKDIDCNNALSTLEINYCASILLEEAQNELNDYLNIVYMHHDDDKVLVDAIKNAQIAWVSYSNFHCESIHKQWRDGSISGIMTISCLKELTKQRTHDIWYNFLTYMDNSTPILPEPAK